MSTDTLSSTESPNASVVGPPPVAERQSDAMCLPQLIELEDGLIAASFRLMKLLPAKYVVDKAVREGRLGPESSLVETSSGTYALGLGIVCSEHGVPFRIVSDPAIDDALRRRLEDLGGEVRIVSNNPSAGNLQVLRLREVQRHLAEHPGAFWPSQYHNEENREAYRIFAEQLLAAVGGELTLVGTVGSGGSTSGTAEILRESGTDLELVGVDTFGSVLFGLPVDRRVLRGLGNSIYPRNLIHSLYDEVHWVEAEDAFHHTRALHRRHALFQGPTSGAAYQVARWIRRQRPDRPVVFICPDEGFRYQDTIYDDSWLRSENLLRHTPTPAPTAVHSLTEVTTPWVAFAWGRRTYEEVVGAAIPEDVS